MIVACFFTEFLLGEIIVAIQSPRLRTVPGDGRTSKTVFVLADTRRVDSPRAVRPGDEDIISMCHGEPAMKRFKGINQPTNEKT